MFVWNNHDGCHVCYNLQKSLQKGLQKCSLDSLRNAHVICLMSAFRCSMWFLYIVFNIHESLYLVVTLPSPITKYLDFQFLNMEFLFTNYVCLVFLDFMAYLNAHAFMRYMELILWAYIDVIFILSTFIHRNHSKLIEVILSIQGIII